MKVVARTGFLVQWSVVYQNDLVRVVCVYGSKEKSMYVAVTFGVRRWWWWWCKLAISFPSTWLHSRLFALSPRHSLPFLSCCSNPCDLVQCQKCICPAPQPHHHVQFGGKDLPRSHFVEWWHWKSWPLAFYSTNSSVQTYALSYSRTYVRTKFKVCVQYE